MTKLLNANKTTFISLAGLLLLIGILIAVAAQRYGAYKQDLYNLHGQQAHLGKLQKDIDDTNKSIDSMKKEQEEFKKMLFEERDVPAFLDGISGSAQKALVYVMEMKTQQFNQVPIPKDKMDPDQSRENKENKAKLNEMLTLSSMPIHFKIHGSFESIVNFLGSIENYRQLLTVSNVQINSRNDYPQLDCEFTLSIYSLKKIKDFNT